jgi:hypothetical protein
MNAPQSIQFNPCFNLFAQNHDVAEHLSTGLVPSEENSQQPNPTTTLHNPDVRRDSNQVQ